MSDLQQAVSLISKKLAGSNDPKAHELADQLIRQLQGLPAKPAGNKPYQNLFPKPKQIAQARFTMRLGNSWDLIEGMFSLHDNEGKQVLACVATSGAIGAQSHSHLWTPRMGPCPDLDNLEILTYAWWCPDLIGVEGYFFEIAPDEMYGPNGEYRSKIGLHGDENQPGSQGCIVIRNIDSFKNLVTPALRKLYDQGIHSIPLKITYN